MTFDIKIYATCHMWEKDYWSISSASYFGNVNKRNERGDFAVIQQEMDFLLNITLKTCSSYMWYILEWCPGTTLNLDLRHLTIS